MKLLQQINNYWIFPTFFWVSLVCLVLEPNWIFSLTGLFFILRIFYTKDRLLIQVSLLCGFILCSLLVVFSERDQLMLSESNEYNGQLVVLPDKIEIDGDLVKVEGDFLAMGCKPIKVIGFYKLSSKQEQLQWKRIKKVVSIQLSGHLERPVPKTNLHGFDYRNYLKRKGIYQTLSIQTISKITRSSITFWQVKEWLSILRKEAIDHCDQLFSQETAMYCKTLLFGFKSNEFTQKETALSELGILHLFSLSGMHVLFFLGSFRSLCLRIGITLERFFWLQLLFSIIYAALTGYSISVLRALWQTMITSSNRQFKMNLSQLDCWSLALVIAICCNPYLLFSIAGQLSYGLSFFIIYIRPIIKKIKKKWLQTYTFSLLLNCCTIPIIGISFFEWQLTSSIFTFFLMPLFEKILLPILTLSFIGSFVADISFLANGLEAYFLCQQLFFEWLSERFAFTLVTGYFSPLLFLIALVIIFLLLETLINKSKWFFCLLIGLFLLLNQKYLSFEGIVAYIDIGQGDSIFIQAPFHRENILIDTGGRMNFKKEDWADRIKKKSNADFSLIPFLKSRGVKRLDKVLISHGDQDHYGDLLTLNNKIPIKEVYFPEGTEIKPSFHKTIERLQKSGTKCYSILAGATITDVLPLEILAPVKAGVGENKDSMVVYTTIGEKRFLFTGDLEKEGEKKLIENLPKLKVDILKVGHHGSKTSSDSVFVQQLNIKDAIISCGRNNRFNHPHVETLQTLKDANINIYQTDQRGMIYYKWTPFSRLSQAISMIEQD